MSICVFRNENEGLDHSALLSPEERLFLKLPDYVSDHFSPNNTILCLATLEQGIRIKR